VCTRKQLITTPKKLSFVNQKVEKIKATFISVVTGLRLATAVPDP